MAEPGIALFLGTVRRGEYETLLRRGISLGVLVDTNSKHKLADVSGFALVERFDFSRPIGELIAAVKDIQRRLGISCLLNVIEFYVGHVAAVAETLGLRGLAPGAAHLCAEKTVMRQRFAERLGSGACARFEVVSTEAELLSAAARLGYPVFLQPSNVSASMWSTCNEDVASLVANYHAMQAEVPRYYAKLGLAERRLSVVLAEYLHGPNTSIDCLVDDVGGVSVTPVVDVLTGRDVGIDDFHHFARLTPSRLSPAVQADLRRLAVAGVQALEMRSCAAHVEFIGSQLGEIAGRPGGNRARILELAFGMDELFAYHEVLCGRPAELSERHRRGAAIVTPFPRSPGTLVAIHHLERLMALPGYLYHEVRIQPGQPVGLAKAGFRAPLYVELLADDPEAVRESTLAIASWTDLFEVR